MRTGRILDPRPDQTHRHLSGAVRSIDRALAATTEHATQENLNEARATLAACLTLMGAEISRAPRVVVPHKRAGGLSEEALLSHVQVHSCSRGGAIAQALGTDTATVRPVMKLLIRAGRVRTAGQARAMSYEAV